ncbi:MAG TPA: N(4)-(beta-N-acetylglucosaminyl)-L-asparaginase [Anaerolineaceae bacterium]
MIVVASQNGGVGIRQAVDVLRAGGSALDAIEAGIHEVEDNPNDHSVGYSGFPSVLGVVETDASIMNGRDLMAGAVGCLKGYRHPISVARKVMEKLPHVFLVGEGADRFAREMGMEAREMLSPWAERAWRSMLKGVLPAEDLPLLAERTDLAALVSELSNPRRTVGTVNFLVMDGSGDICGGVSTSGWYGKYPGRLGDSPVIGAGLYADNRYGAAACTGMGEMSIRTSTARSLVLYMKMGMSIEEAGIQTMKDLLDLGGPYSSEMNIVALDRDGNPAAFSSNPQKTYIYMTGEMQDPVEAPRTFVEVPERWQI